MSIIVIGIDLAKNIFAVHGVNENGKAAKQKGSCFLYSPSTMRLMKKLGAASDFTL